LPSYLAKFLINVQLYTFTASIRFKNDAKSPRSPWLDLRGKAFKGRGNGKVGKEGEMGREDKGKGTK